MGATSAVSEIPQSIAEIDAKTLEQNGIQRLTDALDLNASVARQNTLGGLWNSFAIRGFAGDENMPSGYLFDGFNGERGFGGRRDAAGIERVVLKGPLRRSLDAASRAGRSTSSPGKPNWAAASAPPQSSMAAGTGCAARRTLTSG
ncbi:TonB-dependent receptor plug domain-containing protein [Novosphingobium lindaniclasticum]|uniref:TonB-dependent receptor plug domain-containing protein n=1 Tax=Novosphingobium lindaniclasticum TaxID=1329895 RepID=UPI0003FE0412